MTSVPRELRTDLTEDGGGQSMRVETRVVQPLSGWNGGSQGRIEFQLPRQGILDRSSYLKFQVKGRFRALEYREAVLPHTA